MGALTFTNEEQKDIEKSMSLILDDMRAMWENAEQESVSIDLEKCYEEGYRCSLEINDKKIGIRVYDWDSSSFHTYEKQTRKGSVKTINDYQRTFHFVRNYHDTIRPLIEKEIKKGLQQKNRGFEKLEAVKQHYDKNAEVVFEVGDTNNPPIMILSEEEGKNIGTLYLGDRALKIVVDGPITIVNKQDQQLAHVKRKSK